MQDRAGLSYARLPHKYGILVDLAKRRAPRGSSLRPILFRLSQPLDLPNDREVGPAALFNPNVGDNSALLVLVGPLESIQSILRGCWCRTVEDVRINAIFIHESLEQVCCECSCLGFVYRMERKPEITIYAN